MKKKKRIAFMFLLLCMLTFINVNVNLKSNGSILKITLDGIEALADDETPGEGRRHCGGGRAAYSWSVSGTGLREFSQCVKGCPDKQGYNPLFKDC